MPERTNTERAEYARALLSEYGNGDTLDDLTDLLTDALHLVGYLTVATALRRAVRHFQAERDVPARPPTIH